MKLICVIALLTVLLLQGCSTYQPTEAQNEAAKKAREADVFIPKNDLDLKNYNLRGKVADDPTTILWCTTAFPIPNSPMFTVPIVGKLTSGNKRPYQTQRSVAGGNGSLYFPELPGPDGMFGSSSDYRYGFTPNGMYADWTDMSLFCTQEPMVWQRTQTTIVMETDPTLMTAHQKAREAVKKGQTAEAQKILLDAVKSIASPQSSPNQTK